MQCENVDGYIKREQKLIDEEFELVCLLVKLRNEFKLSQRDLCKLTGINQPSIARIEKHRHSPGLNTLINLLDAIGYKIEFVKK